MNGEADEFCAAKAFDTSLQADTSRISIFTNDSDLVVYGLPEHVRVVQINEMSNSNDASERMLKNLEFSRWSASRGLSRLLALLDILTY